MTILYRNGNLKFGGIPRGSRALYRRPWEGSRVGVGLPL